MSVTVETVLTTARTFLNDDAALTFTDTVLLPKFTQAHRELQAILRASSCPVMRTTSADITVPANTTLISGTETVPIYPGDLVEPIVIFERATTDPLSAMVPMTEADPIPYVNPTTSLIYWQWTEENIALVGSINNRLIQIRYWRAIPIPITNTGLIGFINGELYLAPRTAALMAGSAGANPEAVAMATNVAQTSLANVIAANRGRGVPASGAVLRP